MYKGDFFLLSWTSSGLGDSSCSKWAKNEKNSVICEKKISKFLHFFFRDFDSLCCSSTISLVVVFLVVMISLLADILGAVCLLLSSTVVVVGLLLNLVISCLFTT